VEASRLDENDGWGFVVEKQIPPVRSGMTKKAATNERTGNSKSEMRGLVAARRMTTVECRLCVEAQKDDF
jgi:hypothetical protein